MLSLCPWHLSALQRNITLKEWFYSWLGSDLEILEPEDWFIRGHDIQGGFIDLDKFWRPNYSKGTFLWASPPAAAHVCIEELRKARIKRQDSLHVMAIPRLMTPMWLKALYKTTNLVISITPDHTFWSASEFEPLTLVICFPYLPFYPWSLRGTLRMYRMARTVRQVQQTQDVAPGHILCELLSQVKRFLCMAEHVVRKLLFYTDLPQVPYSHNKASRRGKRGPSELLEATASQQQRLHSRKKRRSQNGSL